jgi:hypothetical protein
MKIRNFTWLIYPPTFVGGVLISLFLLLLAEGILLPLEGATTEDMVANGECLERDNRLAADVARFNYFLFQAMPRDIVPVLRTKREWRRWQESVLERLPREGTLYRLEYIYCEAGFFEKLQHFYQMPAPCRNRWIASREWRTESHHLRGNSSDATDNWLLFLLSLYSLIFAGTCSMLVLQRRYAVMKELGIIVLLWLPGFGLLLWDVFPRECCTTGGISSWDVALLWLRSLLPWLGYWGGLHLMLRPFRHPVSRECIGVDF